MFLCLQAAALGVAAAGGALGRYTARVVVAGTAGTLLKCEVGTTHTFLVFRADGGAADDVVQAPRRYAAVAQNIPQLV